MIRYLSCLFVLSSFAISHPVEAAAVEFTDSVPLPLVRALLGSASPASVSIYQDLPETFPVFELPPGITLLGGMEQGGRQRVILQTTLEPVPALDSLENAFANAGWTVFERPEQANMPVGGFVDPAAAGFVYPRQFCHDDHGMLDLRRMAGDLIALQLVNVRGVDPYIRCADQVAMRQGMGGQPSFPLVMRYMPTLQLPATDANGAASHASDSGMISAMGWERGATLRTTMDVAGLQEFLGAQMQEQGWARQESYAGNALGNSVWSRTVEDDKALLALLSVFALGEELYDLRLRVMDPENAGAAVPALGIQGDPF